MLIHSKSELASSYLAAEKAQHGTFPWGNVKRIKFSPAYKHQMSTACIKNFEHLDSSSFHGVVVITSVSHTEGP